MSGAKQTFFWVVATKGIQTTLMVSPGADQSTTGAFALKVYDCDGIEVNAAEVAPPEATGCVFELEYLLGVMKHESGMRHGLVAIEHAADSAVLVRYQTPQAASLVPVDQAVSSLRQGLVPVACGPDRRTLLALSNCEDSAVQVRGRLLIGKRSPEITWTLDARSSRLVEIESAFAAALGEQDYQFSGRGYIRLSTTALRGVLACTLVHEQQEDDSEYIQIFQG